MIALLGLAGLAVFVGASAIVGVKILLLARRTGGLPEWTIGASLLLAGAVGGGVGLVPAFFPGLPPRTQLAFDQVSSVLNHAGFALLFLFVWRVFRPGEGWAKLFFAGLIAGLAIGAAGIAWTLEPGVHVSADPTLVNGWAWLSLGARTLGYTWAATESFRYYGMLRKRMALGLVDTAVADRFLYWGVCTTAVTGIWIVVGTGWIWPNLFADWMRVLTAALGFVVAGSLAKAFFPGNAGSAREAAKAPNDEATSVSP